MKAIELVQQIMVEAEQCEETELADIEVHICFAKDGREVLIEDVAFSYNKDDGEEIKIWLKQEET